MEPNIKPGETWDHVIQAALAQSRCVVVLWSHYSVCEDKEWVRIEAHAGKRRGILVPVLIDDVVERIRIAFSLTQAANLIGWSGALPDNGFEELARAVEKRVPTPATQPARASAATAPSTILPAPAPCGPLRPEFQQHLDPHLYGLGGALRYIVSISQR